jgi:hypothetical protein
VDKRSFTHRIYVDFSGDDGDPKIPGASKIISIAWVLLAEADIWHNEGIVLKMKKLIGCKKDAELKYRAIRRHRKKKQVLELLKQAKVQLVVATVLKEELREDELRNPRTKKLIDLIHYFPINRFFPVLPPYPESWFQLVFDEVGWAGCEDGIRHSYVADENIIFDPVSDPQSLIFGKSGSILMLQMADIFAGITREYMESLQGQRLPLCPVCYVRGIGFVHNCPYDPRRYGRAKFIGNAHLINIIYPLLIGHSNGSKWDMGFVVRPPGSRTKYLFVDCMFSKIKKK